MIMELLLEIIGYGFIVLVLMAVLYTFVMLLTKALQTLTNNDD
jgi:hypothetical protein